MPRRIRVTVWGENIHEGKNSIVRRIYPEGMYTTIAQASAEKGACEVGTATFQQPQHGLTKRPLDQTDVLVWWGPTPDENVFISWFEGGEVFRSGCTWQRGNGKIFYFRPGHEVYPIYHHPVVRQVLRYAVRWAAPDAEKWIDTCPQIPARKAPEPLEVKGPRMHKEGETGFR